ncbi:hypothetical protein M422DRAFT_248750 [Sphaerobolus stellatus SS14]|nr:hypothetical protein M422DRAFT_248750 [Sphaerobolus stellatus SS14]
MPRSSSSSRRESRSNTAPVPQCECVLGLHNAANSGDIGLVPDALSVNQPVDAVWDGIAALHATAAGGFEHVKLLIENGADVNFGRQGQCCHHRCVRVRVSARRLVHILTCAGKEEFQRGQHFHGRAAAVLQLPNEAGSSTSVNRSSAATMTAPATVSRKVLTKWSLEGLLTLNLRGKQMQLSRIRERANGKSPPPSPARFMFETATSSTTPFSSPLSTQV